MRHRILALPGRQFLLDRLDAQRELLQVLQQTRKLKAREAAGWLKPAGTFVAAAGADF